MKRDPGHHQGPVRGLAAMKVNSASSLGACASGCPGHSCALLIGPEGGWTDPERRDVAAAGWTGASLGPLVLRAETAVCAALAVVGQSWNVATTDGSLAPPEGVVATIEKADVY